MTSLASTRAIIRINSRIKPSFQALVARNHSSQHLVRPKTAQHAICRPISPRSLALSQYRFSSSKSGKPLNIEGLPHGKDVSVASSTHPITSEVGQKGPAASVFPPTPDVKMTTAIQGDLVRKHAVTNDTLTYLELESHQRNLCTQQRSSRCLHFRYGWCTSILSNFTHYFVLRLGFKLLIRPRRRLDSIPRVRWHITFCSRTAADWIRCCGKFPNYECHRCSLLIT
jgi:hypothetical protein